MGKPEEAVAEGRVLVCVPTYNEAEHVRTIWRQLSALGLELDILFVDDNSPDGTGLILDELAREESSVKVIHRPQKLGIGSAHAEGIRWAYQQGYTVLITMDCDLTHSPEYIREFIDASPHCDVVVGSRYLSKESLSDWNLLRKALTSAGHFLTKYLLGMEYDATGAFRLYRLDKVPERAFSLVTSTGYAFFFESLYILSRNGFSIAEVPIRLPRRTYGSSKMSVAEVFRSVGKLLRLCLATVLDRRGFEVSAADATGSGSGLGTQEWDDYWNGRRGAADVAYDVVAACYRTWIIRPSLNHFVRKHFRPGAGLLHAGCGGGQVDTAIRDRSVITALDISSAALTKYAKANGRSGRIVQGSIRDVPTRAGTFDGIYNLGVMEHFSEEDIQIILAEFRRVLKSGGKLLLFWPPEFGSSVIVLKGVHYVMNRVLKMSVKLHPNEISRVRSREHVAAILEKAGFVLEEYYFGPRDLFTQVAVVARKGS